MTIKHAQERILEMALYDASHRGAVNPWTVWGSDETAWRIAARNLLRRLKRLECKKGCKQ
jgi:hypothetical protein